MKTLLKIGNWVMWAVIFGFITSYQSRLIDDTFLSYTVIALEMIVVTVIAVRARARVRARNQGV